MGYFVIDSRGYVADVATTKGLIQMEQAARASNKRATLDLIDKGEADALAVRKIIEEIRGNDVFSSLQSALVKSRGAITMTDGIVYAEDDE